MMKKVKWISGLVLLAVAALPLHAAYLDEDFEGLTVGSYTNTGANTATNIGFSYWNSSQTSAIETGRFDGKSVDLHDNAGGSALYYTPATYDECSAGTLSFDYQLESSSTVGWEISLLNGSSARVVNSLIYMSYVRIYDQSAFRSLDVTGMGYSVTSSNHIEFVYDSDDTTAGSSGTYQVKLNGQSMSYNNGTVDVSDFAMEHSGVRHLEIKDRTANAGSLYLDNITNIPEPATIGLLGFGAIAALFLRRVRSS